MQERTASANLDGRAFALTERKEPNSLGVAVLIVGMDPGRNGENAIDPLIWTITELKAKPETEKTAGQVSIPAETRKNGETTYSNLLGALAEFCNDTVFSSYIKKHLVRMEGKGYREKGIIVGAGLADVVVLIYDGALDFPITPANIDEVRANGWVKKSDLASQPGLRNLLQQVIELDSEENLIKGVVEDYDNNPNGRKLVFPDDFSSIQRFSNEREFGIDVEVVPAYYKKFSERLPEAHKLIVETISLLVEAQGRQKRDYKREESIVLGLKKRLKVMDEGDYAVGIREVNGSGIKWAKSVKAYWEKNEDYREFYQQVYHEEGPDVYRLQLGQSVEKSWGSWHLARGDSLGYPQELGKDWYLVFSRRAEGSSNLRNFGIAPLSGIKELKLRPWDAYGM